MIVIELSCDDKIFLRGEGLTLRDAITDLRWELELLMEEYLESNPEELSKDALELREFLTSEEFLRMKKDIMNLHVRGDEVEL